ncbi:C4-dicarboxylate transporter, DctM subunit [Oscillibacter sp. PC13]|uniref:TRAP transporter large permease n=1 Tax=Oscillibacter sp. PC13 TaxID=1855299 RepID=UPI0008E0BBDF|nr:TRAP transporter large permease [Oscillibacter sp. PC13]SFQ19659.1 C4-dicarboxylate transporter, DctM subunit [Oscillibacter sp. PC13]
MVGLLFGSLAVCLILTVPIAIALAISTLCVIMAGYPAAMLNMLAQAMVTSIDNYALMAIPFFMLLGIIMEKTGIAAGLINLAEAMVGSKPGGLGTAAIVACMFFAAISGSGPACVAAIGTIMIPAMKQQGYDSAYCGALLASGSTIGPVIPPSIPMIVYGATVGVSVTGLFASGVIPGLLMGGVLIWYNKRVSKKRGYKGSDTANVDKKAVLKESIWAILMPVIVLGGIYAGVFTPTEAAVVGVVYALFVGKFVYRQLTLQKFLDGLLEAAVLSASVMIVMGGASTFGRILTLEKVPTLLANTLLGISDSPVIIMLMINVLLLIDGMFIDTTSSIILFAPLLCPIATQLGYDLTYFGLVMCVNLCIGFLTPPLGVNLFVAQKVSGAKLESVIKEVWPMIIILALLLVVIIAFPQLSLFLPKLLGLI